MQSETAQRSKLLTTLYNDYYKALVAYSVQMTSEQSVSEDIVQNVFLRVWEREVNLQNPLQVKTYLYNSVRNESINHLRHQNVKQNYIQKVTAEFEEFHLTPEGNEDFFTEEIYRHLFQRIDALPQRQREVFLLCMEGKTYLEIGEALNISRETVKQRKRKAMEILRSELADKEFMLLLLLVGQS